MPHVPSALRSRALPLRLSRRRFVFCEALATSANVGSAVGPSTVHVGQVSYSLAGIATRPAKNLSINREGTGHYPSLAEALPLQAQEARVRCMGARAQRAQVRRCGTTARARAATWTNTKCAVY